jgi:hypothetical protein
LRHGKVHCKLHPKICLDYLSRAAIKQAHSLVSDFISVMHLSSRIMKAI